MATTPVQSIFYSDLPYQPGLTQLGDIALITNLADIKQAILTIVYTPPGSRLFEPTFGVGIEKYLFEPFSEATGKNIGKAIENGLRTYEPRISLLSLTVTLDQQNIGYNIAVSYLVIDSQSTDSVNVQLTVS